MGRETVRKRELIEYVTFISWPLDREWTLWMQHAFMHYETRENGSVGSRSDASDAFDRVKSGPL